METLPTLRRQNGRSVSRIFNEEERQRAYRGSLCSSSTVVEGGKLSCYDSTRPRSNKSPHHGMYHQRYSAWVDATKLHTNLPTGDMT